MRTTLPLLVILAALSAARADATATAQVVVPSYSPTSRASYFFVPPILTDASSANLPPPIALEPAPLPAKVQPTINFAIPRHELTELDRATVAACLILEAANQGDFGMRGVMAVIRNRARGLPELFVPTVLREKQFSALNKQTSGRETLWRAIERAKRDRMWPQALAIVDDALANTWYDPTEGATHYTRTGERTPWTRRLAQTVTIGSHSFYR
ncbi:MAG TPA: cell wall hydrolase [Opitutaceae bacterium]|nr:cell wall hydrolase [Opitutaceae bacterium]